ncbi:uncharacterized protein [Miscanthus floridulus]|uniref:uncharacterized protein n=1 Tax=Miscanthus floridulus TaxID=154761 RepID=UPI0034573CF1
MAEKSPLRRWKRFLPAFGAIDAAIEAATKGCSRDKYREVRVELVEMLCDAADNNSDSDEPAEGLRQLLDEAMVEALETLRVVAATPTVLETTHVIKAVGDLRGHESGRVRGLAYSILGGWTASTNRAISRCRAILQKLSQMQQEHEALSVPVPPDLQVQGDKKQPFATNLQVQGDKKQAAKIRTSASSKEDDVSRRRRRSRSRP